MSEIHGLAAHAAGAHLLAYKYDPGELGIHDVEIQISHCGRGVAGGQLRDLRVVQAGR